LNFDLRPRVGSAREARKRSRRLSSRAALQLAKDNGTTSLEDPLPEENGFEPAAYSLRTLESIPLLYLAGLLRAMRKGERRVTGELNWEAIAKEFRRLMDLESEWACPLSVVQLMGAGTR